MRRNLLPLAVLALLALTHTARAVVLPWSEDFATSDASWRNSANTDADYWVASGGPNGVGDGYLSINHTLGSGTQAAVVMRGQSNFNSSDNTFVGDWEADGVAYLSFYLRQNSSIPLTIGARISHVDGFPAFSMLSDPVVLQPNVWTKFVFDISPTSPTLIPEGMLAYSDVFSNVGRIQIVAERESLAQGTVVTFDLDRVQLNAVPEPSTLALAGMGLVGAAVTTVRRKRARRV